jgi:hypothetical protein
MRNTILATELKGTRLSEYLDLYRRSTLKRILKKWRLITVNDQFRIILQ